MPIVEVVKYKKCRQNTKMQNEQVMGKKFSWPFAYYPAVFIKASIERSSSIKGHWIPYPEGEIL